MVAERWAPACKSSVSGCRAVDADRLRERARDTLCRVRTELGMTAPEAPADAARRSSSRSPSSTPAGGRRRARGDARTSPATSCGCSRRTARTACSPRSSAAPARPAGRSSSSAPADGVENNCALLADVLGWSGLFMEGGDARVRRARDASTAGHPGRPRRRRWSRRRTSRRSSPRTACRPSLDVLSIDVDGSDYWIWEALERHRPRIVVIEYNGALEPGRRLVQPRGTGPGGETDFYGASIDALVALGRAQGLPARPLRPDGQQRVLRPRRPARATTSRRRGARGGRQLLARRERPTSRPRAPRLRRPRPAQSEP